MSFFFQTIAIPAWFIVFVLACATPLWFRWYKKYHKKIFAGFGFLKKFQRKKSDVELKEEILQKATEHYKGNSELSELSDTKKTKNKGQKKHIDPEKRENIKKVLKMLADNAETGVLSRAVADKCNISPLETTNALNYLTGKQYAEVITGTTGAKYYLTDLGRRYCINKRYI
jgi:predicted transcriptional regulator